MEQVQGIAGLMPRTVSEQRLRVMRVGWLSDEYLTQDLIDDLEQSIRVLGWQARVKLMSRPTALAPSGQTALLQIIQASKELELFDRRLGICGVLAISSIPSQLTECLGRSRRGDASNGLLPCPLFTREMKDVGPGEKGRRLSSIMEHSRWLAV